MMTIRLHLIPGEAVGDGLGVYFIPGEESLLQQGQDLTLELSVLTARVELA